VETWPNGWYAAAVTYNPSTGEAPRILKGATDYATWK
jgi:hypothetical protein